MKKVVLTIMIVASVFVLSGCSKFQNNDVVPESEQSIPVINPVETTPTAEPTAALTPEPTPVPTPEVTPVPTPEVIPDVKDYPEDPWDMGGFTDEDSWDLGGF